MILRDYVRNGTGISDVTSVDYINDPMNSFTEIVFDPLKATWVRLFIWMMLVTSYSNSRTCWDLMSPS